MENKSIKEEWHGEIGDMIIFKPINSKKMQRIVNFIKLSNDDLVEYFNNNCEAVSDGDAGTDFLSKEAFLKFFKEGI